MWKLLEKKTIKRKKFLLILTSVLHPLISV